MRKSGVLRRAIAVTGGRAIAARLPAGRRRPAHAHSRHAPHRKSSKVPGVKEASYKTKNPENAYFTGLFVAYPGGFEPLAFGVGVVQVSHLKKPCI